MAEPEERKHAINGAQVVGSALAAVTSAVLLSTLGVAGTLIGAAASSVVFTVGGTLYTRTVDSSRARMRQATGAARQRLQLDRERQNSLRSGSSTERARLREETIKAEGELQEVEDEAEQGVPWRKTMRELPWKRIGLTSVVVFVVVMVLISAFEVSAGRSVSSFTGGAGKDGPRTTIHFGSKSSPEKTPDKGDNPKDDGNPSNEKTPQKGSTSAPPTDEPTPTEPAQTQDAPAPTEEPSQPPAEPTP